MTNKMRCIDDTRALGMITKGTVYNVSHRNGGYAHINNVPWRIDRFEPVGSMKPVETERGWALLERHETMTDAWGYTAAEHARYGLRTFDVYLTRREARARRKLMTPNEQKNWYVRKVALSVN